MYALTYNWFSAKQICESDGKRLCTADEYLSLCHETGCNVDNSEAWTSTPCDPLFYAVKLCNFFLNKFVTKNHFNSHSLYKCYILTQL